MHSIKVSRIVDKAAKSAAAVLLHSRNTSIGRGNNNMCSNSSTSVQLLAKD